MDQIALGTVYISGTLSVQEFVSNMFYLKTINSEIIICAVVEEECFTYVPRFF